MKIEEITTFLQSKKQELENENSLEYLLELQSDFIIIRSELLKLQEFNLTEKKTNYITFANNLTISLTAVVNKKIISCLEEKTKNIKDEPTSLKDELKMQLKDQLTEALEFQNFIEELLINNKK